MKRIKVIGKGQSRGDVSMHSAIAKMLRRAIDEQGYSGEKVFSSLGISPVELDKSHTRIAAYKMDLLWRAAVRLTGIEPLSVNFAGQFRPASFDGLDFMLATSDTLLDALYRLVRYYKVISTAGMLHVDVGEDTVRVWLEIPISAEAAFSPSVDAAMTLFLQLCRFACTETLSPVRVELQRLAPDDETAFNDFFLCPVHYQSAENALVFRRSEAEKRLPMANVRLARANEQVVKACLADIESEDIASRVVSEIIKKLPNGLPSQEAIARQLCMSTRTLQRKLAVAETSFTELLNQARKELALQYLKNSRQSVGEIAGLLGFSDPSNFTRFFKRLTGQKPSAYFS
ncbi:AraC family transcriptional regulator [Thalassomonas viridans]|uniref:AraC family transcriptional regulator n=1 Tax=Thalassomonas viridans TaxID=137584 RepID=A0AAE9Z818_9GAMM|nr:AraC family transcriptional regulator [Thalassomonas viridans]WDE08471.1 AraC family transcriptional regulator [Thalassomonas viridans]